MSGARTELSFRVLLNGLQIFLSHMNKNSLMNLISNNKEIYQIQLYVALVQETDTIFRSELPASQDGTKVYRVSQEERTKLREGVPYVKLYRYNPKHLCPKLNGFRDNGK